MSLLHFFSFELLQQFRVPISTIVEVDLFMDWCLAVDIHN